MSAFGYGASYMPSWRGQIQATTNSQSPTFNVAPEMPRPNFSPVAANPWEGNPNQTGFRENNPNAASQNMYQQYGPLMPSNEISGRRAVDDPTWAAQQNFPMWRNPLDSLFAAQGGSISGEMPNPKGYTMGRDVTTSQGMANQQLMNQGIYDSNYGPNNMIPDKKMGGSPGVTPGRNPVDPRQLYSQIGGLTLDQLMNMSGNGGLTQKFNTVAQDYSNAYANPAYASGASMSQTETKDWLQKSYESTMKRMNDNFLL